MEEEHERKADEYERDADGLEGRGEDLDSEIDDVKADWEQKVKDEQVPGAMGDGQAAPGGAEAFEDDEDPEAEGSDGQDQHENVAAEDGGPA